MAELVDTWQNWVSTQNGGCGGGATVVWKTWRCWTGVVDVRDMAVTFIWRDKVVSLVEDEDEHIMSTG